MLANLDLSGPSSQQKEASRNKSKYKKGGFKQKSAQMKQRSQSHSVGGDNNRQQNRAPSSGAGAGEQNEQQSQHSKKPFNSTYQKGGPTSERKPPTKGNKPYVAANKPYVAAAASVAGVAATSEAKPIATPIAAPKPPVKDTFEIVPQENQTGEEDGVVAFDSLMVDLEASAKTKTKKDKEPKSDNDDDVDEPHSSDPKENPEKEEEKVEKAEKSKKEQTPKPEKRHRGQPKLEEGETGVTPQVKKPAQEIKETAVLEEVKAEVFTGDKFSDLPINDKLKQALAANQFTDLTTIQKKAIPAIIKERNVVMKSETGSGKTLAYLVPLIEQLSVHSMEVEKIRRDYGTYCIIFSPTRELCTQIDIELQRLTSKMFAYMICSTIMGGENPKKEKARLRKGITILVCTPGRFLYHLQNTENIGLSRLQYFIIDEADRMLDMGFEREMDACLNLIKRRCADKFSPVPGLFHSDSIRMNFISATLSQKVQALGGKLMQSFTSVGFASNVAVTHADKKEDGTPAPVKEEGVRESDNLPDENIIDSIPKQVKQFWMQVPIQYRLLYLLAYLYSHQDKKVIVFASNCETVNLLMQICKQLDWDKCVNRRGQADKKVVDEPSTVDKPTVDFTMPTISAAEVSGVDPTTSNPHSLFDGLVYKLHGDMDHADRKTNFFGFDKAESSLLICTDVASRGLDFKKVDWVVQWDLSSQVKEYVNRVGRTARIASAGQSLCFVMTPTELEYVPFMGKQYRIQMHEKSRFTLMKVFEQKLAEFATTKRKVDARLVQFRRLKAIDDIDEKQESLHCLRQMLTTVMMSDVKSIKDLARVAKNSSTRAYAGHCAEFRHILNKHELNLTEYARSFGIYKVVHQTMSRSNLPVKEDKKKKGTLGKRPRKETEEEKKASAAAATPESGTELFTRRLQKSKLKELEIKMREASTTGSNTFKIKQEMDRMKKAVFTDERKLEQRRAGFERARKNIKATALSEFM